MRDSHVYHRLSEGKKEGKDRHDKPVDKPWLSQCSTIYGECEPIAREQAIQVFLRLAVIVKETKGRSGR